MGKALCHIMCQFVTIGNSKFLGQCVA